MATRLRAPRARNEMESGIKLFRFLGSGFRKLGKQERTGRIRLIGIYFLHQRSSGPKRVERNTCQIDSSFVLFKADLRTPPAELGGFFAVPTESGNCGGHASSPLLSKVQNALAELPRGWFEPLADPDPPMR